MSVGLHLETPAQLSKRRYQRLIMSVPVMIAGHRARTLDWSATGFRLPTEIPGIGDAVVPAQLIVPAEGLSFFFRIAAHHVHRNDDDGYAGYHFREQTEIEHDMLRGLVIYFVSGAAFPLEAGLDLDINRQALAQARATGLADHPELGYTISRI